MTNRVKTVQNPKMILVACKDSERIAGIISAVLNECKYNTCIDDYYLNTDFIIVNYSERTEYPDDVIADTVVFDGEHDIEESDVSRFRTKVGTYEYAYKRYGDDSKSVLTYSAENYAADITCRNISLTCSGTAFDIIDNGILSRVNIGTNLYTVDEVLVCTAVLTATGVPLASVIGYFNR